MSPILLAALVFAADLPPHPRLLVGPGDRDRLNTRIAKHPWAKAYWDGVKKSADDALETSIEIPPRGGAYYHWYIDPVKGNALSRGKQIDKWKWEHRASDGTLYRGDPTNPKRDYDGYACLEIHLQRSRQARDLGLAWHLAGDKRHAERCRGILLSYAELYLKLPRRNHNGWPWPNSGRIATHMLSEALWVIPLVQAADLIWPTLSAEDRKAIEDKILRPCVSEILIPQDTAVHNRQCWKNTAVGLVGLLLGDEKLIEQAIDKPMGFRSLMKSGVSDVGFWSEGSWSYHAYVLDAMRPLTEAARHCGIDLYDANTMRLFEAPLLLSAPNGLLPAFNDGHEFSIAGLASHYELAYARKADPRFLSMLDPKRRAGEIAFFCGLDELPAPVPVARTGGHYAAAGLSVLTRGTGPEAAWLCLKYGPHGGGHGHPDKASFVIYARGRQLAVDPGMALYGAAIHDDWYRTTLAHNTLLVDGQSQWPATGRALSTGADHVTVDAGRIHPGVTFVRTVAMLDESTLVFVDQVESDREHVYDIAYHQVGVIVDPPAGTALPLPDKPGWRRLTDATARTVEGAAKLTWRVDAKWSTTFALAATGSTELITALGIGSNQNQRVPVVVLRRKATSTAWVWALALDGRSVEPVVRSVRSAAGEVPLHKALSVSLKLADGSTRTLLVNRTGAEVAEPVSGLKSAQVFAVDAR